MHRWRDRSAGTWLAAGGVDTHSASTRSSLATVKFASFLCSVLVGKVDKGSSLRLACLVSEHTDALWLDVVLKENLFDVLLGRITQTTHEY